MNGSHAAPGRERDPAARPAGTETEGTPAPASWAARFGRVILEHGLATIPAALFHYQGQLQLDAQDVWFVSYMLAHKWKSDLPHPSLNQMAVQTGVSLRRLQQVRARLEALGYLRVQARHQENRRQTTNRYDFAALFAALETLIAAAAPPDNPIQGDGGSEEGAEDAADSSFFARYGRVVTRAGIATVPLALFTYQKALALDPRQVWFIAYILAHKWTAALPYPSIKRMAVRTGYGERMLHYQKQSLVAAGYLRVVPRYDDHGAQDSNAYDFSPLLDTIARLVQDAEPHPLGPGPAGAPARPAGGQRRSVAARAAATQELVHPGPVLAPASPPAIPVRPAEPEVPAPAPAIPARTPAPARSSLASDGQLPWSDYLALLLRDISNELGDAPHINANITQAHRLWHRLWLTERLPDTVFGHDLVQVARRRTRHAQGAQGRGQIDNKMAYFFQVLRDLVAEHIAGSLTVVEPAV